MIFWLLFKSLCPDWFFDGLFCVSPLFDVVILVSYAHIIIISLEATLLLDIIVIIWYIKPFYKTVSYIIFRLFHCIFAVFDKHHFQLFGYFQKYKSFNSLSLESLRIKQGWLYPLSSPALIFKWYNKNLELPQKYL